jgi:hypothetical protein
MDPITLFVLAAGAMTVYALAQGVVSMAQGGEADLRHSHELMFRRAAWQGLAVFFVLLGLLAEA